MLDLLALKVALSLLLAGLVLGAPLSLDDSLLEATSFAQGDAAAANATLGLERRARSPASILGPLYRKMRASGGDCVHQLDTSAEGYDDRQSGHKSHYCGSSADAPKAVYWLSNMDVDCDGSNAWSGPCASGTTSQSQTSAMHNGDFLDAQAVPYVVMNTDAEHFMPEWHGVPLLGTVAVVCNGKIIWAVYGDSNSLGSAGEGSLRLAQACFGDAIHGNAGHDAPDVLYVAFSGDDAVDAYGGTRYNELMKRGRRLLANAGPLPA